MESLLPRAVSHDAPGIFIDDLHLLVPDKIMGVAMEQMQGRQRLTDKFFTPPWAGPEPGEILRANRQQGLPSRRQTDTPFPGIDLEVQSASQCTRQRQCRLINRLLQHLPAAAGDDERNTGFINQNAVCFIHNAETQPPKHQIPKSRGIAV